jgi:hypothetical protein
MKRSILMLVMMAVSLVTFSQLKFTGTYKDIDEWTGKSVTKKVDFLVYFSQSDSSVDQVDSIVIVAFNNGKNKVFVPMESAENYQLQRKTGAIYERGYLCAFPVAEISLNDASRGSIPVSSLGMVRNMALMDDTFCISIQTDGKRTAITQITIFSPLIGDRTYKKYTSK